MPPTPTNPRTRTRRRAAIAAAAAACVTAAAGVWLAAGSANAGTISGTFYRDTDSESGINKWLAGNAGRNDAEAVAIRNNIGTQPASRWLSNFDISGVQSVVSKYVGAANAAGQIPVLTIYGVPNRDCGGDSAGGAPDLGQYQTWIDNIAKGLGDKTVMLMMEPDSLALQSCNVSGRDDAIATATDKLKKANPNAKIYLDGGHGSWHTPGDMANLLEKAGVAKADGFYTNASNYYDKGAEADYGRQIINALNSKGLTGKHQVIDTSRNGGQNDNNWCGDWTTIHKLGEYPTTVTNDPNVDAFVWIKPPGEADGCPDPKNPSHTYGAGTFVESLAASLAVNAGNPPTTSQATTPPTTNPVTTPPTTPPTTDPVTTPPTTDPVTTPPTTDPVTTPPTNDPTTGVPPATSSGCTATFQAVSAWSGGFQGQITVTAGDSAINGWTVSVNGASISQLWNGDLSASGSTATVRNVGWNGSVAAHGSASFGFIGSGDGTPTVSCTSS